MPLVALIVLAACRAQRQPPGDVVFDGEGLPDCGASYDEIDLCAAVGKWRSSDVEGYDDDLSTKYPIRWIGTEVQPAFCSDDAAEAEAWVLDRAPNEEGAVHWLGSTDPRWTDVHRWDTNGVYVGPDRVMRCDFMSAQAATPPGTEPVADFATYTQDVDLEADFFPVAREFARWRQIPLTLQVILSYGEVHTESAHLRICSVRCGICDDPSGVANITAVLESQDWRYDISTRQVSFDVEPLLEADCQIP